MSVYGECWREDMWIAPDNDRPRRLARALVGYPMLARIHAQANAYSVIANDQIREEFGQAVKLAAELPDDAWLVGVYSSPSYDAVFFIYWSSEFAPVGEGELIPMIAEAYAH